MVEAADYIGKLPLTIDDTPSGLGVPELRSRTRKQIKRHGVQLVIIDYLQLMRPTSRKQGTREREIAELSWAIKGLAREMGVAVVLISQLNRQSEHRSNREPTLSDLRDSGSIEQDADGVMLLYVPEEDKRGNVTLKLAKNRHGAVGQVFLDWDAPTVTFSQIDTRPAAPSTEARHFSKGGYSRD
jgi:replicative DNA helicase